MTKWDLCRCLCVACFSIGSSAVFAQPPQRQPPASSRRITARDGDVVLVNGSDRLTVVHRRHGNVRLVFDPEKHSLLLLADLSGAAGDMPDGLVDLSSTYTEVTGAWPLAPRWEGTATVDEYSTLRSERRILITTPAGTIELGTSLPRSEIVYLEGPPAVVMTFRGSTMRTQPPLPFDEAERRASDPNARPVGGVSGGLSAPVGGVIGSAGTPLPVRPDGSRQPAKLFDVKPTYPPAAKRAGIAGNVVVEITVGTDGAVTDAKVLRGIPELNDAALQAVRQWRYDPTMLNGAPVTLIVTVPFGCKRLHNPIAGDRPIFAAVASSR